MAIQSYLEFRAGGEVAGGLFETNDSAVAAIRSLHEAGMRWQEIAVLADDHDRAELIAKAGGAHAPPPPRLRLLPCGARRPRSIRRRFGKALARGGVLLLVAQDGQKVDTIATLLERAGAAEVATWWQEPSGLFAPPEEGGPL